MRLARDPKITTTWVTDPHGSNGEFIQQRIGARRGVAPSRIVFVLDGSKAAGEVREQIAGVVRELPSGLETAFLFAGDTVEEWRPVGPVNGSFTESILRKLADADFFNSFEDDFDDTDIN